MTKEYYKKKIIDLRADIAKEKEAKKRDNERYADLIKRASTPSSKASYRKSKVVQLLVMIAVSRTINAR